MEDRLKLLRQLQEHEEVEVSIRDNVVRVYQEGKGEEPWERIRRLIRKEGWSIAELQDDEFRRGYVVFRDDPFIGMTEVTVISEVG